MIRLLASIAPAAGHAGGWALLAPIVAIGFALVTKRVIPSLASGVVVAALVAAVFLGDPQVAAPVEAVQLVGSFVSGAVFNVDHLTISAFSLAVAGTVGIMGVAGGTRSLVRRVERYAEGSRGAMVSTWLAGAIVFFDDYANCLVVGNAMGPMCDKHGVSRAKLSYIVDSTAAPVASLALVSTWVGYEVGLIDDALKSAGGLTAGMAEMSAFGVFVEALPYRFYSLFTIVFVGSVAMMGRDFGPMLRAEMEARRAMRDEEDAAAETAPVDRAWLAALPVATLVVLTLALLVVDGRAHLGDAAAGARIFEILGAAGTPYLDMLTGALVAMSLAAYLAVFTGALSESETIDALWKGIKPVFEALVVLYLAWTLVSAIDATGAGLALTALLSDVIPVWGLPTLVFFLAAGTAFATGTSFGTMGILIPIVVPLALTMAPDELHILLSTTAAVLAGACLGDHASPISDTTVLSALGSGVDVVTHVRTQLPYALAAGGVSVLFGTLPAGTGISPYICLPIGAAACIAIVRFGGTKVPDRVKAGAPGRVVNA